MLKSAISGCIGLVFAFLIGRVTTAYWGVYFWLFVLLCAFSILSIGYCYQAGKRSDWGKLKLARELLKSGEIYYQFHPSIDLFGSDVFRGYLIFLRDRDEKQIVCLTNDIPPETFFARGDKSFMDFVPFPPVSVSEETRTEI